MAFSLGNEHDTFIEFPNATHARVCVTEVKSSQVKSSQVKSLTNRGAKVNVRDSTTADPATLDIFFRVNGSG